jgi:hypothetical protein
MLLSPSSANNLAVPLLAKQSITMQKSLAHPVTEMRQTLQIFAYPWLAPRVMTQLLLAD